MDDPSEETALAKPSPTGVDRYEKEFMAGDGTVLYRAKARAHWSLAAMVLGIGGLATIGSAAAAPVLTAATLAFLFLVYVMFAVLRVTVSEGSVKIQLGLWGPTIPISSIIRTNAVRYRFSQFGGWGIRYRLDGDVMYNMPGDGGNALKILWRDAEGKEKTTWVGTREAPALIKAISEARKLANALPEDDAPAALPAAETDAEEQDPPSSG